MVQRIQRRYLEFYQRILYKSCVHTFTLELLSAVYCKSSKYNVKNPDKQVINAWIGIDWIGQPWFITSYDPGQEVRIMSKSAHTWTRWSCSSLFKRRGANFNAIRLMFSSSARMCWHEPYDSSTWLKTSRIVCLLGYLHALLYFRSCACGLSTRMNTIFHRFPSKFETLKPLKYSSLA